MLVLSPFQILTNIAEQCRKFAINLPIQEVVEHNWSGIGFQLEGRYFVAPMDQVTEILHEPNSTKIPRVKSWVRGIANVRGKLLPLIDLSDFMQLKPAVNYRNRRVLVVNHESISAGLIVDDMLGMQTFKETNFHNEIPALPKTMLGFIDGFYISNRKWIKFDLYRLVKSKTFFNVVTV